jgi:hypothetical protein
LIIAPTGVDAYIEYGRVLTDQFEFKDNFIKNTVLNQNLRLDAVGTGRVEILTSAIIAGNVAVTGNISSAGTVRLDGQFIIGDSPIDTIAITPDFTQSIIPGDNNLYDLGSTTRRWNDFYVDNVSNVGFIDTTDMIISDQTSYSGNTIRTLQSNEDLFLTSSTGTTQLENLSINQGTITNLLNSAITITHTGRGYLVINDTNAMVVPVGNIAERTGLEVGETRWNNELDYLECFDGTTWQVATGGGVVVTPAIMEELGNVYTLIFG